MIEENKPEFAKVLYVLGAAFDREITEHVLESYWIALRDACFQSFKLRADAALKSSQFMPRPADLRDAYLTDARERFAKTKKMIAADKQRQQLEKPKPLLMLKKP